MPGFTPPSYIIKGLPSEQADKTYTHTHSLPCNTATTTSGVFFFFGGGGRDLFSEIGETFDLGTQSQ